MKKVLATTFLAAALAVTGFSGQADAKQSLVQPYTYKVVSISSFDSIENEEISEWAQTKLQGLLEGSQLANMNWNSVLPFLCQVEWPNKPVEEPKEEEPAPQPEQPVEEPKEEEPAPQPEQPVIEEPVEETPVVEEEEVQNENTANVTQEEQEMVNLVNQERQQRGLAPLTINNELTKVARVKAQDMIDNNYFDHQSPTYGSPFDMLNHFGISYRTAGENLAGNQSVGAAHQALMNSQGHRENILNSNYTEVGIGVIDGGRYGKMFVQLFKG
ncbi:CAP domain-containing protein [Alkalihalobacillus trypoxylicola]|uniref:SCP domain-containing protein n=1 Tax=Alkalihalobacillus trypoxylicola TaxID=519424 RepID=A0A162EEL5_9BACI|nr:CAP domain-containing protein [Alkalihalobacillus trypoxylicola]KYG32392.1 hypothetical protein AZF04_06425 [Alkalihalobacillus trypoxylicola]